MRVDTRQELPDLGVRGTVTYLGFQVMAGVGLTPRRQATYVSDADLVVDDEGRFEFVLATEDPGAGEVWVQIPPDASAVVVRQYVADRRVETLATYAIASLDPPGPMPTIDDAAFAEQLTALAWTAVKLMTLHRTVLPGLIEQAVDGGYLASAYTWHRRFLELLQSEHPGTRWLIKTPFHVWTLPELMREYPGALLVQTHRDPARVMASTTSLLATLRKLGTDEINPAELGPEFVEIICDGMERSVDARLDGTVPADQVADVQFNHLMADPLGAVRGIYEQFGLDLQPGTEALMASSLRDNPRSAHGGYDYTFADTGLDLATVRARTARYSTYFGVPEEPC